jgi:hypothetical protein
MKTLIEWILDYWDWLNHCTCEQYCIAEYGFPAPVRGTPGCDYCTRKGFGKVTSKEKE